MLGDTDQAVEAANHLAVMCDNAEDLATWTDICTGVYATFGDSLPIEGLTESANETAKVGQVTGSLADALNWAGISEEDFNLRLRACTSEQERQDLIMNALNNTYKTAADQYRETNAEVIAANEAQEKLNGAMAKLGEIGEPIMTGIKNWVADMVNAAVPHLESIITAFSDIGGTWENQVWPMLQEDFKAAFGVELPDWATTSQNIKDWWTNVTTSYGDYFKALFGIDLPEGATVSENIKIWWENVSTNFANVFKVVFGVDLPSASDIAKKISEWWSGIKSSISGLFNINIGTSIGSIFGGKDNADSSSAVGLDRVPRDGYLIRAHKDETLLNARDADIWRGGGSGRIEALLSQLVANTSGGQQIVLESGVLVGQIASQMDTRLGTISSRKGRGN